MKDFQNKVVVVTGGAKGIGKAIAEKFNNEGAKLVIFGRDAARLEIEKKSLNHALAVQGDVRNIADLDRLYAETVKHFGKIDVLVANAGVASRRTIDEVDEAYFDEVMDINLKGVYFTVQRAVPCLNENASVILISSIAAHFGWPGHSVYSAAKAAVSMLARNFSADLIGRKIRVNAISPGYTNTPIFDNVKESVPNYLEEFSKEIPAGRFAEPEEIAEAAAFLSSSKAAYIVGTDLVVGGGSSSFITE